MKNAFGKNKTYMTVCFVEVLNENPDKAIFHLPIIKNLRVEDRENEVSTGKYKSGDNYVFEKISWKSCTSKHFSYYNYRLSTSLNQLFVKEFSDINTFYKEFS